MLLIKTCRRLSVILAIATILLGTSVIVGWELNITSLIRYQANTIAMVMNTAACFIVMGGAVLLIMFQHYRIALACVIFTLILTSIIALQNIFGINFGIDQLIFQHYDQIGNAFAGRMAPNTTFCFITLAIALLSISPSKFFSPNYTLAGGLGTIIFCLAALFLSGYNSNIEDAYIWSALTPMAMNTALGFILLAGSIVALTWEKWLIFNVKIDKILPAILSVSIFITISALSLAIAGMQKVNNQSSNLALITFISGCFLSLILFVIMRLSFVARSAAIMARESLSLVRATLEATTEGIIVINNDKKIIDYNQNILENVGYK